MSDCLSWAVPLFHNIWVGYSGLLRKHGASLVRPVFLVCVSVNSIGVHSYFWRSSLLPWSVTLSPNWRNSVGSVSDLLRIRPCGESPRIVLISWVAAGDAFLFLIFYVYCVIRDLSMLLIAIQGAYLRCLLREIILGPIGWSQSSFKRRNINVWVV